MMNLFFIGLIIILTITIIGGAQYQNFQIAGVVLAPEHAADPAVSHLQKRFRQQQMGLGAVFIGLFLISGLDFMRGWRDFWQILLLFAYIIVAFIPFYRLNQHLNELKKAKGWVYQSNKRQADLSVTREKGKAAPAKRWVWLIWLLTWIPLIISFLSDQSWEVRLPALIIPIVLVVLPLTYPMAIRSRTPFTAEDSEVTKTYMRRFERIHGLGYVALMLCVSLFFIGLFLMMLQNPSSSLTIVWTLLFLAALTAIMVITFRQSRTLLKEFTQPEDWQINDTPTKFVWGVYYNQEDPRLFVPKQVYGMGTTINAAHPAGKVILGVTGIFIVGLIVWVLIMTLINFQINITADTVAVQAPMYGFEVPLADIERIELTQSGLDGNRTNGYGGQDKSYGYFTLENYGSTRLFVYTENDWHIDILLDASYDPQWLIYNEQTLEETEAVYQELVEAWENQ